MISLTSTAHGETPGLRQGSSLRWAEYQHRSTSCWRSTSRCCCIMTQPIVACRPPPAGRRDRLGLPLHTVCMDPITSRNRSSTEEPEVYWRRRLFALAAGLAVLGLLAWAVGGASSTRLAATTASVSSQAPRISLPPAVGSPSLFASSSSP